MKCLKCGEENRNNARKCFNCNTPLSWTPDSEPNETEIEIKASRIALIAICLAFLGLMFLVFGFLSPNVQRMQGPIGSIKGLFFLSSLVVFILAFILGIVSLLQIGISGGRRTGIKFSTGAILIAIFGSILPIGMFFFARTQSVAYRYVCQTNLSGLGKAMLIYANDYNDELPRAGGPNATWGTSVKWDAINQQEAYGMQNGTGGSATISSSLFLLVKYAEVRPSSFICKGTISEGEQFGGDKGVIEFIPPLSLADICQLWDFGPNPWLHNSYSYHNPYGGFQITTKSDPCMPVAADRNPWILSPGWHKKNITAFNPTLGKEYIQVGNTPCHNNEGQNVLFLDSHVEFKTESFCGINNDNIYTSWSNGDIVTGKPPIVGSLPANKLDSLLVNDPPVINPETKGEIDE